jgi:two-component system cell cycle sensor histidine kinase/response regulator CckA
LFPLTDASRARLIGPLWLFGFLPAVGATRLMGYSLDWFFSSSGVMLGGGVFLLAYLMSGWVMNPARAVVDSACRLLRGLPPDHAALDWLPKEFHFVRG